MQHDRTPDIHAFGLFSRLPPEIIIHHIVPPVLAQGPGAVDAFSQTCTAAYQSVADAAQHTLVAWSKQTLQRNSLACGVPPSRISPPNPFVVQGARLFLERISVQSPMVYGRAALKRERFAEAAEYFKTAVGQNQDLFGAHLLLLKALRGTGDAQQLAFWTREALRPLCEQQEHKSLLQFCFEAGTYDVALAAAEDYLSTGPKAKRAGLFFDDLVTMPDMQDPQARARQCRVYDRFLERLTRPSRAKYPPFANLYRYTAQRIAHKKQMGARKEAHKLAMNALLAIQAAAPQFTITNQPDYTHLGDIALAARRLDVALGYFVKSLRQHHGLWDEMLLVTKYLKLLPSCRILPVDAEETLAVTLARVGTASRLWDEDAPTLHTTIARLAVFKGQPNLGMSYLLGRKRSNDATWGLSPAELLYLEYFLMQQQQPTLHVTRMRLGLQPESWTAHQRAAYEVALQDVASGPEQAQARRDTTAGSRASTL